MKLLQTCFIIIVASGFLQGQVNKDSILLYERTIDRPLTLHGGQLRISGAYGFSINSKRYDQGGKVINRNDEGLTDILNMQFVQVKYGLHDMIGLTANISYQSQGIRSRQEAIIISPDPSLQISSLTEIKGFTDLYLGTDLRAPFNTRKFELATSVGINLPTAKSDPEKPEHSIESEGSTTIINYHYNENWGAGTLRLFASGIIKFRTDRWAFTGSGYLSEPTGESSAIRWTYQTLDNNTIEYQDVPYNYFLSRVYGYQVEAEFQPIQWLAVFGQFSGEQKKGGWTDITTKKIKNPDSSLNRISLGYEILVTSKLWFRQQLSFPLTGKNNIAPFSMRTSLSYNFFPFYK